MTHVFFTSSQDTRMAEKWIGNGFLEDSTLKETKRIYNNWDATVVPTHKLAMPQT